MKTYICNSRNMIFANVTISPASLCALCPSRAESSTQLKHRGCSLLTVCKSVQVNDLDTNDLPRSRGQEFLSFSVASPGRREGKRETASKLCRRNLAYKETLQSVSHRSSWNFKGWIYLELVWRHSVEYFIIHSVDFFYKQLNCTI